MRVLLDESLPRQLAAELRGHDVATVQSRGWSSLRNGELLRLAVAEGIEVFVTAVVIRAVSNRMEHLLPLLGELLAALQSVRPGALRRVGTSSSAS